MGEAHAAFYDKIFHTLASQINLIQTIEQNTRSPPEIQTILSDFFEDTFNRIQNFVGTRLNELSTSMFSRIECLSDEVRAKYSYICDEIHAIKDLVISTDERRRVNNKQETLILTVCRLLGNRELLNHSQIQRCDQGLPLTPVV